MIRRWLALMGAVWFAASSAQAEVEPTPSTGDPKIQTVAYDPNQVVRITVALGFQATIRFGGETIMSVALGDSDGWQAAANRSGELLFVKPTRMLDTNLTVLTDGRIYNFRLVTGDQSTSLYMLQFEYPNIGTTQNTTTLHTESTYRWKYRGAASLKPVRIFSDADHVYIEWAAGVAQPAVFVIKEGGKEGLASGATRNGFYVIDGLPRNLRFEIDRKAGIVTRQKARKS